MPQKLVLFLMLVVIPTGVLAQVEIGGYILTDTRLFFQKNYKFYWNENRFDLKIEASPLKNAQVYIEFWGRSFGLPEVRTSSDLMQREKDKVFPWSILFREAYVDLYGFISPNLDVRIGLQRIAWGTGDKLNPTDNLNPDDLEDIWDFGRHLGSHAIKMSYYLGEFTLTAVFIPVFTPATLPIKEWAEALSPPMELPLGVDLGNLSDKVITPENSLKESSMFGIKIAKNLLGYDFSLSYFYGRDDIPIVNRIKFISTEIQGTVDVLTELIYPRVQILGMDMAGAVGDVGIWAESALFFPEKVNMSTDLTGLGMGVQRTIVLDKPYFRYVVGADYTFKSGWYLNLQYLHGFIHERREDDMGDYFIFSLEKKLLGDKLKIALGGGAEIQDFTDIKNNYALILGPQMTYFPFDNTEITLGFRILEGKERITFGRVKDNDEVYFKAKYSF